MITVAPLARGCDAAAAGLMQVKRSEDGLAGRSAPPTLAGDGAGGVDVGATAVRVPSFRSAGGDETENDAHGGTLSPGDGSASNPSIEALIFARPGEPGRINRFAVLRLIGAGGMGVVYAAYDEELDRRVAIKVLRDDRAAGSDGRSRMLREAQAMAKLSHPNVVQVYEVGEFAGQIFMAMEFIKGKSLREWLVVEERGVEEILEVFVQAGRGLAAAHRQGIVHRDFKPDNVLIDGDGTARVLDFGLARAEFDRASEPGVAGVDSALTRLTGKTSVLRLDLTLAGTLMGTPAYMSPEQFAGGTIDWRSDQFSMCVALYAAVYHQPPFGERDAGLAELQASVNSGALRAPPAGVKAPTWLFPILKTGLAKDPNDRHPSMDTLLAALAPERSETQVRGWWWPAVTLGVAAAAVLVTLQVVRPEDPTVADLAAIERYTQQAREAAAKLQWVYPEPGDLKDTAYNRVVLLEALDGAAEAQAAEAAIHLRGEFSEALVALGDRYFDDPDTRAFARDYYVQALLFMPLDPRASNRAGVTVGQLADLGRRVSTGEFFATEVIAAEPLRILAETDRGRARERALAFAQDPARSGVIGSSHLTSMLREEGLLEQVGLLAAAEPAPVLAAPMPAPEPAPEPVVAPLEPVTSPVVRANGSPRVGTPKPPVVAAPVPVTAPEPAAPKGDPEGSRALSAEGDAAMQRGDTATATQRYKQALDLWNQNAAALMGLSDIAFDGGKFERAAKYAEQATRAEPGNGDYQLRLGDAYFKAFRYSDAEARYKRAAELKHPKASERLARVRAELGG